MDPTSNSLSGSNSRLDPTGDMFLKGEDKRGGPSDPIAGYEESVNMLFPGIYKDYTEHPMQEWIKQYSFAATPGAPLPDRTKTESGMADNQDMKDEAPVTPIRKTFRDVSKEISYMSESKKNMMNCNEIFVIYLRECSSITNETYYHTVMKFVLMFRECLNTYGWQKRAENECKDFYGHFDYERRL
jgi:hypothetical protein